MIAWLLTAALAAEPETAAIADVSLSLGDAVYLVDEPARVEAAPGVLSIQRGLVFPIRATDGEGAFAAGFALIGTGALEVAFPDPRDAERFANRAVMERGAEPAAVRPIAREGAPLEVDADAALFFGLEAGDIWSRLGRLGEPGETADGVMVVLDTRSLAQARRRAQGLLDERARALDRAGLDPRELLAIDRARAGAPAALLDVQTVERGARIADGPLTFASDPAGLYDGAWRSRVLRAASAPEHETGGEPAPASRRISGAAFPPMDPADPSSPPLPPDRAVPGAIDVVVRARISERGWRVRADVESELQVQAVGAPDTIRLRIPRFQSDPASRHGPVTGRAEPTGWGLTALELDGRDISGEAIRLTRDGDRWETLLIPLERPMRDGEERHLRASWTDDWPLARVMTQGSPWATGGKFFQDTRSLGSSTGQNAVTPLVVPASLRPAAPTIVRVGVPEDAPLQDALTGDTTRRWAADGWRWVESESRRPATWLALGTWRVHDEPPAMGLPGVRVLTRGGRAARAGFPAEVRRAARYFSEHLLPAFPLAEVEVFEHAQAARSTVAPGVVGFSTALVSSDSEGRWRDSNPHYEHRAVASAVALGYWSALDLPHARDRWIHDGLMELYAGFYVRAAFGRDPWDQTLDGIRDTWGDAGLEQISLTGEEAEGPSVRSLTHYLFARVLSREIGQRAMLAGLDRLLAERAGRPTTTEHLQEALERASGRGLEDLFRLWVYGGALPELSLSIERAGPPDPETGEIRVRGVLRSSRPFGRMRVPVRLRAGEGEPRYLWVEIVDGEGAIDAALAGDGRIRAHVDPGRVLPIAIRGAEVSIR